MPGVDSVKPKMWEDIIPLFDDGDYSAIWGCREKSDTRSLGVRWNGSGEYPGYPNQGKNSVWYSEPKFLQQSILSKLLELVKLNPSERQAEFKNNILIALSEC